MSQQGLSGRLLKRPHCSVASIQCSEEGKHPDREDNLASNGRLKANIKKQVYSINRRNPEHIPVCSFAQMPIKVMWMWIWVKAEWTSGSWAVLKLLVPMKGYCNCNPITLAVSTVNLSRVVPHGLLVFFPSFPLMEKTLDFWRVSWRWEHSLSQFLGIFQISSHLVCLRPPGQRTRRPHWESEASFRGA